MYVLVILKMLAIIVCTHAFLMHIYWNLVFTIYVAKNKENIYMLHGNLSTKAILKCEIKSNSKICLIGDLLARYQPIGEIIQRELPNSTKTLNINKYS